ncbi:unnamed protein product [Boreogadus saida]
MKGGVAPWRRHRQRQAGSRPLPAVPAPRSLGAWEPGSLGASGPQTPARCRGSGGRWLLGGEGPLTESQPVAPGPVEKGLYYANEPINHCCFTLLLSHFVETNSEPHIGTDSGEAYIQRIFLCIARIVDLSSCKKN